MLVGFHGEGMLPTAPRTPTAAPMLTGGGRPPPSRSRAPTVTSFNPATLWKTKVPLRHQRRVMTARLTVRQRTDPRRPLPGALVIGGQRCGTSSLYKYLEHHPLLLASMRKEIEYFSTEYARGEAWYRAHFASRARHRWLGARHGTPAVAYEATPLYLFHPLAPARTAALVPNAKLIVVLRDPVERAWSHYHHEARRGREVRTFEAAIAEEPALVAAELSEIDANPFHSTKQLNNVAFVSKGRYAEQIERWLEHFPRERFLFLRTEDLFGDPAAIYREITAFLAVPAGAPPVFANYSYPAGAPDRTTMAPQTRSRLQSEFRPHNQRLYELIGRDMDWPDGT